MLISQQIDEVKKRRKSLLESKTADSSKFPEMPLDLVISNLKDSKYLNAFTNPEVFPINKTLGKRQASDKGLVSSKRMQDILIDQNCDAAMMIEYMHRLKLQNKGLLIPYTKLKEYENKLKKACNMKELNNRIRSISPDNFFKYKDFYGSKPEIITESPTKIQPSLKDVYSQKVAGFESELTRKIKSKKLECPFEWKMDAKTPERPFRDRFKIGSNKVSGKITVPTEENAFLAMTHYFEGQHKKEQLRMRTQYDWGKNDPLIKKNIPHNKGHSSQRRADSNLVYQLDMPQHTHRANPTPKLDTLQKSRQTVFASKLPQIKAARLNKARRWKENRAKRASVFPVHNLHYNSTNELNIKGSMF